MNRGDPTGYERGVGGDVVGGGFFSYRSVDVDDDEGDAVFAMRRSDANGNPSIVEVEGEGEEKRGGEPVPAEDSHVSVNRFRGKEKRDLNQVSSATALVKKTDYPCKNPWSLGVRRR